MKQNTNHIIGIAGNAGVGKDTLCQSMINLFNDLFKLKAVRRSIAGDQVREDLKDLVLEKFGINIYTSDRTQKNIVRPLMVEYGRIQRLLTNGRYFIDKFVSSEDVIDIVPDIRYAEYEKDELEWVLDEKNGFLIYLERNSIDPANEYERINNIKIKDRANLVLNWPDIEEDFDINTKSYAKIVITEWFKSLKL